MEENTQSSTMHPHAQGSSTGASGISWSSSPNSKMLGAYYTPEPAVAALTHWAIADFDDPTVLDPSCGDGRFIAGVQHAVGVDVDPEAAAKAQAAAPSAAVIKSDFFEWAASTDDRFDAVVGNPPFIRYQRFTGAQRQLALSLCRRAGVEISGLASSWAPFVVASTLLLNPAGKLAFVVPAEIGHAVYARPLIRFLLGVFSYVEVVAVREKFFDGIAEDCWLLRLGGYGGSCAGLTFSRAERIEDVAGQLRTEFVEAEELARWNWRLRPLIVERTARAAYWRLAEMDSVAAVGDICSLGIGYVTGGNRFFHLRPSEAASQEIPAEVLCVTVRSNRDLGGLDDVSSEVVERWFDEDRPCLLLNLKGLGAIPESVRKYLDSPAGDDVRKGYKCRNREPWYGVPDVRIPDAFLTIMSTRGPRIVANSARAVCTNSILAVFLNTGVSGPSVFAGWSSALTEFSCEIEGHALGGGMLKLEPREARRVRVPLDFAVDAETSEQFRDALRVLRRWRGIDGS